MPWHRAIVGSNQMVTPPFFHTVTIPTKKKKMAQHDDDDLCFNRLAMRGHVSRLIVNPSCGTYSVFFHFTVNRDPRPTKVLRACGEFWGTEYESQILKLKEGSFVKVTGYLKPDDCFDLELLEVIA